MKWESKTKLPVIDWTKIKELTEKVVSVEREDLMCFRLIPDKSITNHENYKFFKDIYELERMPLIKQVFENIKGATQQRALRFTYRPATDYVWYEIVITAEAINFYVICYESHSDYVWLKLEQAFPNATIELADESETEIPYEDTVISDLRLQRHNFFSLHTDYSEQSSPIADILMGAEDVKEGDVVKFMMRTQPYDQAYWSYKCEEWHKKTLKGKAPKRLRITKAGAVGMVSALSEIAYDKLGEFFRNLHGIAFKRQKDIVQSQLVVQHDSRETREIGDISKSTHYKSNAPVFDTVIRVASHSEDETRRLMNLKSLSNSFIDLRSSNNAIVRGAIHEKPDSPKKEALWKLLWREVSQHAVSPLTILNHDRNILCDRELGKLWQLPTAKIQKKYDDKMDTITRKEVGIPEPFLDSTGIFIGHAIYRGERLKIYIPNRNRDEFVLPIVVSGIQGSGKDTFGVNWVVENALQGRGAVIPDVIDEKGRGMSDAIIQSLPKEKLVILDFADEEFSPYLDWAEAMKSTNRFTINRMSQELVKFFEADDEAGIQTERFLKEAALALPSGTLIEMGLLFVSDEFREQVIEGLKVEGRLANAAFWEIFSAEGEGRRRQIAAPILNRLHKLTGDPTMKPIFGQKPTGKIDFSKWLWEGKVIICKIPKTAFSTLGIRTLMHWLIVKTWLAKQEMQRDRLCESILLLNEPHQYLNGGVMASLMEAFPECRKFGLQIVSLFHDFAQIPRDLADIMLQAGANFILLKQRTDKSWKKFEQRIESEFSIDDCMEIKMHEAMVGFLIDKKDQPVIRVEMNDMPFNRGNETYDNSEYAEFCRREYGRPIQEVEAEVLQQELTLMMGNKKKKEKVEKKIVS